MAAQCGWSTRLRILGFAASFLCFGAVGWAVAPDAKTVPWVANNPLIPHDVFNGEPTLVKGQCVEPAGENFNYIWDFGDGSTVYSNAVTPTNQYALDVTQHAYNGPVGTIFTAVLTCENASTGETDTANYFVVVRDKTLETEVNRAIDEGLWYLHRTMNRTTDPSTGLPNGNWTSGFAGSPFAFTANDAANVNAFEVNGHLETGSAANPYTETVMRGLRSIFAGLSSSAIADQTNPLGTFNPDANGNGYGVRVTQGNELYQGGMIMDAIVASGTPGAVTTTGALPAGANPGIRGRGYSDIVQDMTDYYSYCQYDLAGGGGWRYGCNQFPDNSANQWAAIGMIPAERNFGAAIPQIVKDWNQQWLTTSQNAVNGIFGYTDANPIWGPYATTPSGMVQMTADGIGRGDPRWDLAETFIRDNFPNGGNAGTAIKLYYYGLFSFTKSMLLHDSNADQVAEPIQFLQSQTAGVVPIDWYRAQAALGDPTDGVARTLVDGQSSPGLVGGGYWTAHNFAGDQYVFETAWAIIMLNRTVFESGVPVAVIDAVPNPVVAGATVNLSGSDSFHQDPSHNIISWAWDLDNDGAFDDASGVTTTTSFPVIGTYPVGLLVCDDDTPEKCDDTSVNILVTTPPVAPTADANGPYNFCLDLGRKFFLDGSGSANPDEGQSEPGQPGDTIQSYEWDLNNDVVFDDASGSQPDVTAFYTVRGPGTYLAQLRVTDTTATSYPSSNGGSAIDLFDTASAQVHVLPSTDQACLCINDLVARPKSGKIQLTWTNTNPPGGYNVYRTTTQGGPYSLIAHTTSTFSTYLDETAQNNTTYYYVVREAALNGDEVCQSNEASGTASSRAR